MSIYEVCVCVFLNMISIIKWRGSLGQLEDDAFSAINVFLNSMDDHVEGKVLLLSILV